MNLEKEKLDFFIGANGVGKTTLLDIISGLHNVKNFNPPFTNDEIVYQIHGIYMPPVIKGKDLIRLILKSDSPRKRFTKLASEFREKLSSREQQMLEKLWDIKLGDMSVGERRWTVIRLVAELDRNLYIFDEPIAGVEPASRPLITEALERLTAREDAYVIMSTHILHELTRVNCQMTFLHERKIVFEGDYQPFLSHNNAAKPPPQKTR